MSKYLIEFKSVDASALFEYDEDGYLIKYSIDKGKMLAEQSKWVNDQFPYNTTRLQPWIKFKNPNIKVKAVEEDLSFAAFYDRYGHKVSKRSIAEKAWERLDDVNKAKAIAYIAVYETHLAKTKVNKKYPETYLNSDMWNN